jgi:protein gp37
MSDTTKIEWCDSTFNPWIGCARVSPACDDCYAARSTPARTLGIAWGAGAPRRRTSDANWRLPLQWERKAEEFQAQHGRRRRVFCASLADVFDNEVADEWRADLFELIAQTPHIDWLLLTKRIGNAGNMLPVPFDFERLYPNVWLGATVVTQAEAERDIPKLLAIPAAVRFLSIEPMLGPIDLERPMPGPDLDQGGGQKICQPWLIQSGIGWVIVGGESGPHARPMQREWARVLRDQCAAAGVPFVFKQWGEHAPNWLMDDDGAEQAGSMWMDRMGKKTAGRLLDGVEHNEFPRSAA